LLASNILGHISDFFKEPEFTGKSSKIGDYVAWALRPGGPAYYDVPTPQDGTVDRKDPNYVVRIDWLLQFALFFYALLYILAA
jgi:hypothetical protein